MTRLILVRHGRSQANLSNIFAGHTDAPLAPLGQAQAELVADHLAKTEQINAVYASDLSRAVNTALPTARRFGLTVNTDADLREIFAGEWENLTFAEINDRYHTDRQRWYDDLANAHCTGGETVKEVYARVKAALLRIAEDNEGKTVLVVSHWTCIYSAFCLATDTPIEQIRTIPEPRNCAVSILTYENNRFSSVLLNDTAHLEDISRHTRKD